MFQYKVIHNQKFKEDTFFNKKELGEIKTQVIAMFDLHGGMERLCYFY